MNSPAPARRRLPTFLVAGLVAVLLILAVAIGGAVARSGGVWNTAGVRQAIEQQLGAGSQSVSGGSQDESSQGDQSNQNDWGSEGFGQSDGGRGGVTGGSQDQVSEGTTSEPTAQQANGVVVIQGQVDDQNAVVAGTGMVLTASGLVLTNNHVVADASSIEVTVPSTGATYRAVVVGTDATDDVAVLQLRSASNLSTVTLDDDGLSAGDEVVGVGNAGGTGSLVAASGTVTALDQNITTQAEQGAASESLSGLIETDAAIQSGDSGGPLLDAEGEVVGMDTAASTGGQVTGYAIPIKTAVTVAKKLVAEAGGSLQLAA